MPGAICGWRFGKANAVYRIDMKAKSIHHVAGTGESGFTGHGEPAVQARLSGPKGLSLGPDGKRLPGGYREPLHPHGGPQPGHAGAGCGYRPAGRWTEGDPLNCRMGRPHGVFVDSDGSIFVGDTNAHRVRVIRSKRTRGGLTLPELGLVGSGPERPPCNRLYKPHSPCYSAPRVGARRAAGQPGPRQEPPRRNGGCLFGRPVLAEAPMPPARSHRRGCSSAWGERLTGSQEVVGSIPISSTRSPSLAQRLAVKNGLVADQRTWSGFVKEKEASHDAAVGRACRAEIEALARQGAKVRRIRIDAELKSLLARRSETARAREGKAEADRERRLAAAELQLPIGQGWPRPGPGCTAGVHGRCRSNRPRQRRGRDGPLPRRCGRGQDLGGLLDARLSRVRRISIRGNRLFRGRHRTAARRRRPWRRPRLGRNLRTENSCAPGKSASVSPSLRQPWVSRSAFSQPPDRAGNG